MIRPHQLSETSTFVGQTCALCKQEFTTGDSIVICPEDGSRHHAHCWEANNNHCTAYGCTGQGVIGDGTAALPTVPPLRRRPPSRPTIITPTGQSSTGQARSTPPRRPAAARPIPNAPGSKVRTLPAGSFGCVPACFVVAFILVFILVGFACAAAWFLTGYAPQGSVGNNLQGTYSSLFTSIVVFQRAFITAL
jgi:hypothetical protein